MTKWGILDTDKRQIQSIPEQNMKYEYNVHHHATKKKGGGDDDKTNEFPTRRKKNSEVKHVNGMDGMRLLLHNLIN